MPKKSVMYFVSGEPQEDVLNQQIVRVKAKDERDLSAGKPNTFLKNYADKVVRVVRVVFVKDKKENNGEMRFFYSLKHLDKDGLECEQESMRALQAAQNIYNQHFSDAWAEARGEKKESQKNEFDAIEFQRLYIWQPTKAEHEFLLKEIMLDLASHSV